ncbi:MAG: GDP-mannose 4,6-dehydratase [Candidatus Saccharimonadales bacterium]
MLVDFAASLSCDWVTIESMSRLLVTGVNGFVGQHLVRLLVNLNHEVVGVGHSNNADISISNLLSSYAKCDLTDVSCVEQLTLHNIDAVINLAGLAKVGESFEEPERYKHTNVAVLSVLGEALLHHNSTARVICVSTGAVYDSSVKLPITEESPLVTNSSPYGLSKIMMEQEAVRLRELGLDCVIARPFNHFGPGQKAGFLIPDLYAQAIRSLENQQPLLVGNLQTKRDYTDVRDIVRAYTSLALAPELHHNVFNVCSGSSRSGQEVLDLIVKFIGGGMPRVETDPRLIRPTDPMNLYGSYNRLQQDCGWSPQIPFEQTIADFIASVRT